MGMKKRNGKRIGERKMEGRQGKRGRGGRKLEEEKKKRRKKIALRRIEPGSTDTNGYRPIMLRIANGYRRYSKTAWGVHCMTSEPWLGSSKSKFVYSTSIRQPVKYSTEERRKTEKNEIML